MPELPEAETIVRGLRPAITGRRIARVEVLKPDVLRESKRSFSPRVRGRTIEAVERRAKNVLVLLDGERRIAVNLGMTGRLLPFATPPRGKVRPTHPAVRFRFMDGSLLVFDDTRRFGTAERLTDEDCANGWILDGFPRTLAQAETFEQTLKDREINLDRVVSFDINPNVLIDRLSGRLTCKDCGAIYHKSFNPPSLDNETCDQCGGEVWTRPDDREEAVAKRLDVFVKTTRPLIHHYTERSLLGTVEADGSVEEVAGRVEQVLGGS